MKTLHQILLCIVWATAPLLSSAQDYPQKTVNGQKFYEYTMDKSEGFFALYRKFGIRQEEVLKYNPEAKDGLKLGQKILIPVPEEKKEEQKQAFIEHVALKKQTVYSISKLYNVAIDSIYKYNPETRTSLQEGYIIKIPVYDNTASTDNAVKDEKPSKTEKTDKQEKEQQPSPYKKEQRTVQFDSKDGFHTVQAGETIYSIAQNYNLSVSELLDLNPFVKGENISEGEILRVLPFVQQSQMNTTARTASKLKKYTDEIGRPLRIAFLLPFMLDKEGLDAAAGKFYEFYQGSLIAIDSLKKQGVSVTLYVYDTDRSDDKIQKVLARPELREVDFIIGPAYTTHVKAVSTFARNNNIRLIVPFSLHPDETLVNPNIFQCNIGGDLLEQEIIQRFDRDFRDKNIILLRFPNKSAQMENFAKKLSAHLDSTGVTYHSVNYQANNVAQIESLMKSDKENLLCIINKNHGDLLSVMPVLNTIEATYSIFGFSEWLQMSKTLEDILTHNTYFYSQFQVNYDNPEVKDFLRKYTAAFDNDISKTIPHYNMLGYDITYYFIELALMERENPQMAAQRTRMLQNEFCFKRISNEGGHVNKSIFLINYKNQ